jgi:serine/threonine-protein kinase
MEPTGAMSPSMSQAPTITTPAMVTGVGMILGTAAYMSPEQARGQTVDKRTDIWAFGCVLYEMLSGRRAFDGENVTDVLSRVLQRDPDFDALPTTTPRAVRKLIRRCLQKDHRSRLRDIGDAKADLAEPIDEASDPVSAGSTRVSGRQKGLVASLVGALLLVAAALAWLVFGADSAPTPRLLRVGMSLPPGAEIDVGQMNPMVFSPDGSTLLLSIRANDSPPQLYTRSLAQFDLVPIPGTERANSASFSPDGQWLYFNAERKLKRVAVKGGTPQVVADPADFGAVAGPDDTLIYTPSYTQGLWRVPSSGGTPEKLTDPDTKAGELGHWWPQLLPDGDTILFTAYVAPFERSRISLYSLRTRERTVLIEGGVSATYVATGHILYARADSLMAVPFDLQRREVTGRAVPVIDDVEVFIPAGSAYFTVSDRGDLAYIRASEFRHDRIVSMERTGGARLTVDAQRAYESIKLSPDARRLAVTIREGSGRDVWIYELERGAFSRATSGPKDEFNAIWTPDGKRLIFTVEEPQYNVYWKAVNEAGNAELLVRRPHDSVPMSVSPDGKFLVFRDGHPETGFDLWRLPLEGKGEPRALVRSPFQEDNGVVSPDGRWLAYQSDESGRAEIYVQGFPDPGERWPISTEGGTDPAWSRDGRELFYRNLSRLMSVAVGSSPRFIADKPAALFERPGRAWRYDVGADPRSFILAERDPAAPPIAVSVVLNWFEELKRLVPTN